MFSRKHQPQSDRQCHAKHGRLQDALSGTSGYKTCTQVHIDYGISLVTVMSGTDQDSHHGKTAILDFLDLEVCKGLWVIC